MLNFSKVDDLQNLHKIRKTKQPSPLHSNTLWIMMMLDKIMFFWHNMFSDSDDKLFGLAR